MNMRPYNLSRGKVEVLCYGIRMDDELLIEARKQNPFFEKRAGYSDGAYIWLGEGKMRTFVDAPVWNSWVKYSPLEARGDDDGIGLYKGEERLCGIEFVEPPRWYLKKTSDGTPAGRLVQQHGKNHLATAVWSNCSLFLTKEECRFCLMGYNKAALEYKDPQMLLEALEIALDDNPDYELVMNSGTPLTPDRGALLFARTAAAVRKTGLPMVAELAPPVEKRYFEMMRETGIDGVMMNLETYDDGIRRTICPGKSKLASRERYFEAFHEALDVFGPGRVTSVLLAGLERKESTVEGAKKIIEMGVIPEILVFRGTDGTPLQNFPIASPDDMEFVYREVGLELLRKRLDPSKSLGCFKCGGCNAVKDYYGKIVDISTPQIE